MSITIRDENLSAEFARADKHVMICGHNGRMIGIFTPMPEPEISDEELLRRLNDPNAKWYTAAQVEAKMREWQARGLG